VFQWLLESRNKQQEYLRLFLNTLQQELPDLFQRLQGQLALDMDPRFIAGKIGSSIREQNQNRNAEIDRLHLEFSRADEKWKFYFDQLQKHPDTQLRKSFGQLCEELEAAEKKASELEKRLEDQSRVLNYERITAQQQVGDVEVKVVELNRIIAKQHHQLAQLIGDEYVENQDEH